MADHEIALAKMQAELCDRLSLQEVRRSSH
jgi:hypothetical protein